MIALNRTTNAIILANVYTKVVQFEFMFTEGDDFSTLGLPFTPESTLAGNPCALSTVRKRLTDGRLLRYIGGTGSVISHSTPEDTIEETIVPPGATANLAYSDGTKDFKLQVKDLGTQGIQVKHGGIEFILDPNDTHSLKAVGGGEISLEHSSE